MASFDVITMPTATAYMFDMVGVHALTCERGDVAGGQNFLFVVETS